jgi:hypothetical protein
MSGRSLRRVAATVVLGLLVPVSAGAYGAGISFPPVAGSWEGAVFFSGQFASDSVFEDGGFSVSLSDVIDSTTITVDFTVDANGQITGGEMKVDLTWFKESVGADSTGDPYRLVYDHHQTGVLALSGTADRLVASGTLLWETNTSADGDVIEEVSGSEPVAIEWVFQAYESTCAKVGGNLIEASGNSLMATALVTATGGEGTTYNNALVVELLVWPSEIEDAEKVQKVQEALEALQDDAGEILSREFPEAEHVYGLVKNWEALNAELAGLASCQAEVVGWVPESGGSWLVGIVQLTLAQALESQDHYDVADLVGLWVAGFQVGAMDGELIVGFLDAFDDKLDEAISLGDVATIQDVLVFAAQYGYSGLYAKAKTALVAP